VGIREENKEREEKGKGLLPFGVTILPLNGKLFSGQQRMRKW